MKRISIFIFLLVQTMAFGQTSDPSVEKFIRIIGQAEKEVSYSSVSLELTLTEVKGNEYNQIRPKDMQSVEKEFQAGLQRIGISVNELEENKTKNIGNSRFNKLKSKTYNIVLKSEDDALKVADLAVDGFKVGNLTYIFPDQNLDELDMMALDAIDDAKRKANNIAKAVDKKVGSVLNIEDLKDVSGTSRYSSTRNNSNGTKKVLYKVKVTFELL